MRLRSSSLLLHAVEYVNPFRRRPVLPAAPPVVPRVAVATLRCLLPRGLLQPPADLALRVFDHLASRLPRMNHAARQVAGEAHSTPGRPTSAQQALERHR